MAKRSHIKLTDSELACVWELKNQRRARRLAAIAAGEYDGRFSHRVESSKKGYNRVRFKRTADWE